MKNKRRIDILERRLHDVEVLVYDSEPDGVQEDLSTAPPQPSFGVDEYGAATHHCADMPDDEVLRYCKHGNVWRVETGAVFNMHVNFCPCCGADFRDVTVSKVKYHYMGIVQSCPHCGSDFSTYACPCQW